MTTATQPRETLYDIGEARDILESWLAETEGELTPEIAELLDGIDAKESDKVERVALFVREVEGRIAARKAEETRLAAGRRAMESRVEWLTQTYLRSHVERYGTPNKSGNLEIRAALATVALQKNPPSVVELVKPDAADFRNIQCYAPELVKHIPESFAWEKDAIKAAHKAGTLPESVTKLVSIQQSQSLRIR